MFLEGLYPVPLGRTSRWQSCMREEGCSFQRIQESRQSEAQGTQSFTQVPFSKRSSRTFCSSVTSMGPGAQITNFEGKKWSSTNNTMTFLCAMFQLHVCHSRTSLKVNDSKPLSPSVSYKALDSLRGPFILFHLERISDFFHGSNHISLFSAKKS